MIILGYDPGVKNQGFSIVEYKDGEVSILHNYTFTSRKTDTFSVVLNTTFMLVKEYVETYKVDVVAVEKPVFATAFGADLNRLLGVVLLAIGELPLHYFAPNEIKRQVTGNGKASKDEVEYFVTKLSGYRKFESNHAADATACALCYLSQLGEAYGSHVSAS